MSWSLSAEVLLLCFPIPPPAKFCTPVGSPDNTNKLHYLHRLLCDEDKHVSTILLWCEFPVRHRVPYSNLLCHHTTMACKLFVNDGGMNDALSDDLKS